MSTTGCFISVSDLARSMVPKLLLRPVQYAASIGCHCCISFSPLFMHPRSAMKACSNSTHTPGWLLILCVMFVFETYKGHQCCQKRQQCVFAGPKVRQTPACVLCPVVGPPLRGTSCGRFCHVGCAQWLEETFIQGGLVHGLHTIAKVLPSGFAWLFAPGDLLES